MARATSAKLVAGTRNKRGGVKPMPTSIRKRVAARPRTRAVSTGNIKTLDG